MRKKNNSRRQQLTPSFDFRALFHQLFLRPSAANRHKTGKGGRRLYVLALLLALVVVGGSLSLRQQKAIGVMRESNEENTLVIDAGHGGFDGGAVGATGVCEQDINLSIAQRVQALAGFFGVPTVMTRPDNQALGYDPSRPVRENKVTDIKERERIVNETPNPIFISIHLNKFSDAQYHGAQVFYSVKHAGGRTLADALQQSLIAGVDPTNHRQAKQAESSIYLLKKLTCPAVIVECGFLSNPNEEQKLTQPDYHKQMAVCIVRGYLQYKAGLSDR